jgi:ubiquinone/menaquinone biosynthesis C-methylase UbiE
MDAAEEAVAYDELERLFGAVLFQGFAESAVRMGVTTGRVLDVGTGPGRIAIRLAKLNPNLSIEAIDFSKNMLSMAERNARDEGVGERIRFSVGDAKQIPFPNHAFDLVVCHNMLHQLADPLITVREINRVTKPNGAILVRDVRRLRAPVMTTVLPLYCLRYGRTLRRLTYASYRAGLTSREFVEMAEQARIEGARVTKQFITHQSLERPAVPCRPIPIGRSGSWMIRFARSFYVSFPGVPRVTRRAGGEVG